jgi:hypothetical protein
MLQPIEWNVGTLTLTLSLGKGEGNRGKLAITEGLLSPLAGRGLR